MAIVISVSVPWRKFDKLWFDHLSLNEIKIPWNSKNRNKQIHDDFKSIKYANNIYNGKGVNRKYLMGKYQSLFF